MSDGISANITNVESANIVTVKRANIAKVVSALQNADTGKAGNEVLRSQAKEKQ